MGMAMGDYKNIYSYRKNKRKMKKVIYTFIGISIYILNSKHID